MYTKQTDFERINDKEATDYGEISVDYDDFVHKISEIVAKSPTRQAKVSSPSLSTQVPTLARALSNYNLGNKAVRFTRECNAALDLPQGHASVAADQQTKLHAF